MSVLTSWRCVCTIQAQVSWAAAQRHHRVKQVLSPDVWTSYNNDRDARPLAMRYQADLFDRLDNGPGGRSFGRLVGTHNWTNALIEDKRPNSPTESRPVVASRINVVADINGRKS